MEYFFGRYLRISFGKYFFNLNLICSPYGFDHTFYQVVWNIARFARSDNNDLRMFMLRLKLILWNQPRVTDVKRKREQGESFRFCDKQMTSSRDSTTDHDGGSCIKLNSQAFYKLLFVWVVKYFQYNFDTFLAETSCWAVSNNKNKIRYIHIYFYS